MLTLFPFLSTSPFLLKKQHPHSGQHGLGEGGGGGHVVLRSSQTTTGGGHSGSGVSQVILGRLQEVTKVGQLTTGEVQ